MSSQGDKLLRLNLGFTIDHLMTLNLLCLSFLIWNMGYKCIIHFSEFLCTLNELIHVKLLENSAYNIVTII